MAEMISLPGPEADWAPATSPTPGNPARQCSVFQAATEPLISLALLAVELDSVARRLRLTVEESWDEHGALRAAFFTLDGTDFVVTHHERDPAGTYVWVRKSGPVDPAGRMAVLLAALGVGPDAVVCSTWGVGTDLSDVAGRLEQGQRRAGRVAPEVLGGIQQADRHVRRPHHVRRGDGLPRRLRPRRMGGVLLSGLREWLADTKQAGRNLVWSAQVVGVVFPDGRLAEPWSPEEHRQAVAGLFALLEEFFAHLQGQPGATP